jgi:hypothetical protein
VNQPCDHTTRSYGSTTTTHSAIAVGGEGEMSDEDPNEAYEVVPVEPGPHGPPHTWWTVKRKGVPVRYFPGKEKAQRTDPEYRASLATTNKLWKPKK